MEKTIKQFAEEAKKSPITIQRWVRSYNEENTTSFKSGTNDLIDKSLILFLQSKVEGKKRRKNIRRATPVVPHSSIKPKSSTNTSSKKKVKQEAFEAVSLQKRLSADWLIMSVILSILASDMVSFYVLSNAVYGDKLPMVPFFFAPLGLICGIGAVVTYNRIQQNVLAEGWKYGFALLQFVLFEFALAEMSGDQFKFISGQTIMSFTQVAVFTGALRSIKR